MAVVTMKQLLDAGVHFGHQTRRWNPKMKRFLYGERNGIYIIDLHQTLQRIAVAYGFVRDLVADGGTILFVGTKKQAQDPVAEFAASCGMPYVNERWLGGMLTNFETIAGRVRKLGELEGQREAGDFEQMPKKEALLLSRELEKLERNLGGIRGLRRLPNAIFVIDTKKEHIAVTEANKLDLPVIAVVDTNCDPDVIDYVIPGNDDAIRSGRLMCRVIAEAVIEGRFIASKRASDSLRACSTEQTAVAAGPADGLSPAVTDEETTPEVEEPAVAPAAAGADSDEAEESE
jgi:small subunit ribosomal protein S2